VGAKLAACIVTLSLAAATKPLAVMAQSEPPPLIFEPNQYSYTFGVPAGWTFSLEQGRAMGTALVFFPKGGSFDQSASVIYISSANSACKTSCKGAVPTAMERDIEASKRGNPNLRFESAPAIAITVGGAASVIIMSGAEDKRQAREAVAYIEHEQTIILVVLTTKDPSTWVADYEVFRQIVAGHRFFDCKSSNLAVPCR
jgi:hypothetical protein